MTIIMAADRYLHAVMLEYDLPPMEACAEFMESEDPDRIAAVWDVTNGRPRLLTSRTCPWTSRAVIERSDGLRATVGLPWGASVRGARTVRLLAPWETPEGDDLSGLPDHVRDSWILQRRNGFRGPGPRLFQ